MLKNKADRITLLFVAITTGLLVYNWRQETAHGLTIFLACFFAISVSTMVHNHVHVSTFKSPVLNAIYDYWLTVFYGYPVFAWIATHNQNHHVYTNKKGDFAPSYLYSEKNNLWTLLQYPTISGGIQQKVNWVYLKKLYKTQRGKALYYSSQFLVLVLYIAAALYLNWKKALLYVVLPQQVSLNVVLIFNYVQHIHCDEESKWNHSRNAVGKIANFFLFNNGLHTAHHLKPLKHWSELRAEHEKIAHHIDDRLNEKNVLWLFGRLYFASILFPSMGSFDMRGDRIAREKQGASSPSINLPSLEGQPAV